MGKMRVTTHRGRVQKGGANKGAVFSAKHNDRNFDLRNASHIDSTRVAQDLCYMYNVVDRENPPEHFAEHEQQFYEKHFSDWLDCQNEKYRKKGNYDRIKTMAEVIQCQRYAPEEVIMQIGNVDESVDRDTLVAIHGDFIRWHIKTYPQCVILDSAGHFDESTGHYHDRFAWVAHDEYGNETIGQEKALEEMGYQLPEPYRDKSRFNNRKITYTAEVRSKFVEICEQYGLEIEKEPLEKSKTGLTLTAYQCRRERERAIQDAEIIREQAKLEAEQIRKQAEQERLRYEELRKNQQRYILETARQLAIDTNEEFAKMSVAEQRSMLLSHMQADSESDDYSFQ